MMGFIRPSHGYGDSLWSSSATPATPSTPSSYSYEPGVKFYSDVNGSITAIRFYKGTGNTGTHIGYLWTNTGKLLASATFTSETASGWQQVNLPTPVPITANTIYIASYWDPGGHYSITSSYFTTAYNNPPLHALANGTNGPNGVFSPGANAFPTQGYQASNYWVDVVFVPGTTVIPPPSQTLTASPTSLSFGNVTVGSRTTLPVVVTSTGSASVTVSQVTITGAGFYISGPSLPLVLAAGKNTTFSVTFAPATVGTVTGKVSVVSNASNSPAITSLSGTGVNKHSVTLSWLPSTSVGVIGYNVYRGTVSGGPYTKLNSLLLVVTTYTDTTVQAGQTYYYVTTAVNSEGTQSAYSNQAKAVVPFP